MRETLPGGQTSRLASVRVTALWLIWLASLIVCDKSSQRHYPMGHWHGEEKGEESKEG